MRQIRTFASQVLRTGALLLLIFLTGTTWAVAGAELDGRYIVNGATANEKSYGGELQIKAVAETYAVGWKLSSGETYVGLGLRQGDILGAAYGPQGSPLGVVVYTISDGVLDGVWADSANLNAPLGRETLEGSPDLQGEYRIALGQNRDGQGRYGGKVQIIQKKEAYYLVWFTDPNAPQKPTSAGIGVRNGNTLTVTFGKKLQGGVVAYHIEGDQMNGIWATGGSGETGTEILLRKP